MKCLSEGELAFIAAEKVSNETIERLRIHESLLKKWSAHSNLVAKSTLPHIWFRHFLDSAQLLQYGPSGSSSWLDLGTGAGFPGMVLAIIGAEKLPTARFTLVEANRKKCEFLFAVADETGVDVRIRHARSEDIEPQNADAVTARAVSPLARLLELAKPHLARNGFCIFPKGVRYEAEICAARLRWNFAVERAASITNKSSAILMIRELRHA